ncbi:hypothetical protein J1N35_034241 [Gossypium stocksii]|uniref:Uncharacterized protein n=1 Tax=Gossypium stocksii TaxID=47602 RepID=A0A9D3URM2_9ROSI|nr:hypothetical protein J1N35_034241 [Gossypium stocksii]
MKGKIVVENAYEVVKVLASLLGIATMWFNNERPSWDDEGNYVMGWSNKASINQWIHDGAYEEGVYDQWEIISNQRSLMIELLQQRYEAMTPLEEVVHDVPNSDYKDHCIDVNHPELDYKKFGTGGQEDELNVTEGVVGPINLVVNVAIDVDVALTTDLELKPILSESVDEPTHFFATVEKIPYEEVNEFISFSFDDNGKARVNRSSRDIEVKMLDV